MKGIAQFLLAVIVLVCANYSLAGNSRRQPLLVAQVSEKEEEECKDGQTKKVSCNSCFCANGSWACTLIGCPEDFPNVHSRSVRQAPRGNECSDGQTKREDCNDCFCRNGHWGCTLKLCRRKRAAQECQPGEFKRIACNQCRCVAGGWACSRRVCV